jgi:hypothetical protein
LVLLSRRRLFWLLGAAPFLPRAAAEFPDAGSGAESQVWPVPVITRRILIPATGITLPALLARPVTGRFPARILLDSTLHIPHDNTELLRRCAKLAAGGFMLIVAMKIPLRTPLAVHDRQACLGAIEHYLSRHPAVLRTPNAVVLSKTELENF